MRGIDTRLPKDGNGLRRTPAAPENKEQDQPDRACDHQHPADHAQVQTCHRRVDRERKDRAERDEEYA